MNGGARVTATDSNGTRYSLGGAVDAPLLVFIHGLGQGKVTDAATLCGGAENIIKVEAQQTFINGLRAGRTWGSYTPRDAMVYCKA